MRLKEDDIHEETLMAGTLCQRIFDKGKAYGEVRGRAQQCASTSVQVLIRRTGALDAAVSTRIRSVSNMDTLDVWLNEALALPDAESAHRLIEKISKARLS